MGKVIGILLLLVLGYLAVAAAQVGKRIMTGKELAASAAPFERVREDAEKRLLIMGDSTGVGTGASAPEHTIAGRFAAEFPELSIRNISENGLRLNELAEMVQELGKETRYDMLLIQVGGNDIIRFTDRSQVRASLRVVLGFAEDIGAATLVLHSGNVGTAPFFPWPTGPILTDRTRQIRQIYVEEARQFASTAYVDLFRETENDPFSSNPEHFYAGDMLHLSDAGYAVWYEKIRETMDSSGITF